MLFYVVINFFKGIEANCVLLYFMLYLAFNFYLSIITG